MSEEPISNDSSEIIAQALEEMKKELGAKFNLQQINLAELERRTGVSRAKLRKLQKSEFIPQPHGNQGKLHKVTVLTGYTGVVDTFLMNSVTNSSVILDRLRDLGYNGGRSQLKLYISQHKDLVPAKRQAVDPQGNRGFRYETGPGEIFQMDWGFTQVESYDGKTYQAACFVMVCHHCGERYVEFFPNAKQENLFIGMLHGFAYMGIPGYVMTDNMKSVVIGRDPAGKPLWQHDYEAFMKAVGFQTKLCKPRHPFTKGAVERLVRFVKENFMAGRVFSNVTDLNCEALNWCNLQNGRYQKVRDGIPSEIHFRECVMVARPLVMTPEIFAFLCPARRISFDGFVTFEGRRFGVPLSYGKRICRVCRDGFHLHIYSDDLSKVLVTHDVTWKKRDTYCKDQYIRVQPEELPTTAVKTVILQKEPPKHLTVFDKFNFDRGGDFDE